MTRAQSIAALAAAFTTNGVPTDTVEIYLHALHDISEVALEDAVRSIIETQEERWFPTIASIRRIVFERQLALPSPEHAWELIQNDAYRANAPAAVRQAIAAVGGSWALRNAPAGMIRGQFIQQYRDARQRSIADASTDSRAQLGPGAVVRELGPGGRDAA